MVRRIKNKYIYISFLVIIILIGIVVLPTYAKFPSNYVTSDDVVGFNLSFDVGVSNIEEYQEVSVSAGETKIFNVEVTNSSGALAYYGVWYRMNTPTTKTPDITIARLGTTETTTSGSLEVSETKTISVIIKNNTNSNIIIDIGVNSSTTSTADIEYLSGKRLISGVAYVTKGIAPNLDSGNLIPVYYDDTAEVWKKADSTNTNNSWYDYENKMWANAVIVDTSKKATYQSASIGTTVTDADIIAFYVWIPRYKYRVWNINRQGISETGTGATVYAYTAYSTGIEIEFENGIESTGNVKCTYDVTSTEGTTNLSDKCYYNGSTTPITTTDLNTTYTDAWYTHPAFTFDGVEKNGFWMGKFETSGTADAPTVIPDVVSLRSQNISTQFTTSKKFQSYLSSGLDAHMLTNLEWGAVAYLTHSTYGLCTDNAGTVTCKGLNNNNSAGLYTGRSGGDIANGGGGTHGTYNYKGYKLDGYGVVTTTKDITKVASTTGNITGVYDMSGGSFEFVMANMVNSSGAFYPSSSGTSWNGSTTLNGKYYNVYSYGTATQTVQAFNRARLGDATAEVLGANNTYMASWKIGSGMKGSDSTIVANSAPWYSRGGTYNGTNSGLFNFIQNSGSSDAKTSFRSSIS